MRYTVQGFKGRKYRNLVAFAQVYIDLLKLGKSKGDLFILADPNPVNMGRAIETGHGERIIFLNAGDSLPVLMQTLAHEMVHIKQYAKGHLRLPEGGGVIWRGKEYLEPDSIPYSERPWEMEAMKRETLLYYKAQEVLGF